MLERLPVSLLPVADEVGVQDAGPPHAAFEEGEPEIGKATRHPAEEQCLAHGIAGGGEVADVVVGEVRWRQARALPAEAGVKRRRDAELRALRPERIVVVLAVEAERVVPGDEGGGLGVRGGDRVHRPLDHAAEHRHLEAELLGAVRQLLDSLIGRVHGDDGSRCDAVGEVAEIVGGEDVERAAGGPARLVVGDARNAEPHRGVEDREVEAQLAEPLVEEPRQHRRGAVTRVLLGRRPERLLGDPAPAPLRHGHRERLTHLAPDRQETLRGPVAADAPELLADDGPVLQPVAVGVDHRMGQPGSNLRWARMTVAVHGTPPGE